jgi:hypothetical protein
MTSAKTRESYRSGRELISRFKLYLINLYCIFSSFSSNANHAESGTNKKKRRVECGRDRIINISYDMRVVSVVVHLVRVRGVRVCVCVCGVGMGWDHVRCEGGGLMEEED